MLSQWIVWLFQAAWSILVSPLHLLQWVFKAGDEAYTSLDHLALNVTRPQTEWLNMGNWENADEFPQACHDLAQLLYKQADLKPGASVLDVGHGSGDSLLLLAREYRPSLLHGVTSMQSHSSRAESRMAKQEKQLQTTTLPTLSWQIYCDDAVKFLNRREEPKYDFIFALDCAYHFQTRKDFIKSCKARLKPGGKVALVDLVASHPYPLSNSMSTSFTGSSTLPAPTHSKGSLISQIKHHIITFVSGVPIVNLISIKQYQCTFRDAGFDNIAIKDISHLVFPGFAKFLHELGKKDEAAWRGGGVLQTTALNSFGSVVEGWSKGGQDGMVRCVLVVAQ